MPLPKPTPGLVVRYSYLWRAEYLRGQEEGVKDRPCAIIMMVSDEDGDQIVTVLPITHSPPRDNDDVVEIPAITKRRLGLDDERSWIVITEANRFIWPGPDLRPVSQGDNTSVAYGMLPEVFFERVRASFLAKLQSRKTRAVPRTE